MVRIAKRLIRFNIAADDANVSSSSQIKARRIQYSCEKCGKIFGAWKHLRQHKVEKHSY